jgi:recombination protein RecA
MSQALRKLTGVTNKSNAIIVFINQLRQKIGIVYGNPETTTGGRALKFYATVRMEIRKSEALKNGDDIYGNRTKVKIAKNKVAAPFKVCEFDIVYGEGVSHEGDVLDMAVDINLINRSGAWYSYGDTRVGQGRENAKRFLKDNKDIYELLKKEIKKHYCLFNEDEKTVDKINKIDVNTSSKK